MNFVNRRERQRGSLLLEVMVALLILGVGLLALYRLQLGLVSYGNVAAQKSQATYQAQRIMESMRTNKFQLAPSEAALISAVRGTDANSTDAANFTFSLLQAAQPGVANLNMYVGRVTWTDQLGQSQQVALVSYANTLMQAPAGSLSGGGGTKDEGYKDLKAPDFENGKTYKKDSIVSLDGKQYILNADQVVGSDATSPGTNSVWQVVKYYADGELSWWNTEAVHGVCTIEATAANGAKTKCAPQKTSGAAVRTICPAEDVGDTNKCYLDNKSKRYYRHVGVVSAQGKTKYYAYQLRTNYSCLIAGQEEIDQTANIKLSCSTIQGSTETVVASQTYATSEVAAKATGDTKEFDSADGVSTRYELPLQTVANPVFKTDRASTVVAQCTPDMPFWETVIALPQQQDGTFTSLYQQGDAVCFSDGGVPKLYVARAMITGQYNVQWGTVPTYTPNSKNLGDAIWVESGGVTCNAATAGSQLLTPSSIASFTSGQTACFLNAAGDTTVDVDGTPTSSGLWVVVTRATADNGTVMPGEKGSKWSFLWREKGKCYKENTASPVGYKNPPGIYQRTPIEVTCPA
ncbi:type IV pilus modification PilV family protein [Chitinibacteraceae bacterium HSL-7]